MRRQVVTVARSTLVLLALVSPSLRAQNPGLGEGRPFRALVVSAGAASLSVAPLNAFLANSGFASVSRQGVSIGLNGYYAFGRALLGADLSRATIREAGLNNGRTDNAAATQAVVTAGYALLSTPRLTVYPVLGVGTGRFTVDLRDNAGGTAASNPQPTFAEAVQRPGTATTLTGNHLVFNVGIGQDYFLVRRSATESGIVVGFRAGLAVAPNRTTWSSAGRTVIAGPDASAGGPFLRIVVGIGTR